MTQETMYRLLQVLRDPKMGYRPLIIHQTECSRYEGKIIEVLSTYGSGGVIHPATKEERKLLPEEFRKNEAVIVYCHSQMTAGEDLDKTHFRTADTIDPYDGTYWRVVSVKQWGAFPNCYYEALAVKTDEDPWEKRNQKLGTKHDRNNL